MGTGYAEKKALFDETTKALLALGKQSKRYGVDEAYNWCRFILGEKPQGFTPAEKLAAAFFMQTVHKFLDGLADVRDVGGTRDPYVVPLEFKPVVTYRMDEQIGWHLLQARILGGGAICHLSTDD